VPDIKDPEEIKDANTVDNMDFSIKGSIVGKWSEYRTC
jgi:hypothetical protein